MSGLTEKKCKPCEGGVKPFTKDQSKTMMSEITEWTLSEDGKQISRDYNTKNFITAVKFISKIADVAEGDDHHPDIHLTGYRRLRIELSTHAIGGLSENDFIVAAKINALPVELKG